MVIEGLDGSGKSTLARELSSRLDAALLSTPGEDFSDLRARIDELFGDHPHGRQLLYAATVARCSDLAREHLASGRNVVIDRYLLSTQVYASLRGPYLLLEELTGRLTPPDLTVFVDCRDEERLRRMRARRHVTADDTFSIRLSEDLRSQYLDACRAHPLVGELLLLDSTDTSTQHLVEQIVAGLEEPAAWRV